MTDPYEFRSIIDFALHMEHKHGVDYSIAFGKDRWALNEIHTQEHFREELSAVTAERDALELAWKDERITSGKLSDEAEEANRQLTAALAGIRDGEADRVTIADLRTRYDALQAKVSEAEALHKEGE